MTTSECSRNFAAEDPKTAVLARHARMKHLALEIASHWAAAGTRRTGKRSWPTIGHRELGRGAARWGCLPRPASPVK
jgi:hypothetical protein